MAAYQPRYRKTHQSGRLQLKAREAAKRLSECTLCPRLCRVDRSSGETGYCSTAAQAVVASYHAHFGEEEPLVGTHGSGTIFFTHCNLLCNFCQNYDISHQGAGHEMTDAQLSDIMLSLQSSGCHNINLVTPSHVVPQILAALAIASEKGLNIPLVYNTGGYDRVETLKLLEAVVDIYMPDFKFWDSDIAEKTCQAPDYPEVAQAAFIEMHRQVGDLSIDENGLATSGLLVRHLVLPEGLANTKDVMTFIAKRISPQTYVNIMPQYRPCGRASDIASLNRSINQNEYAKAVKEAIQAGIKRFDRRRRTFVLF